MPPTGVPSGPLRRSPPQNEGGPYQRTAGIGVPSEGIETVTAQHVERQEADGGKEVGQGYQRRSRPQPDQETEAPAGAGDASAVATTSEAPRKSMRYRPCRRTSSTAPRGEAADTRPARR